MRPVQSHYAERCPLVAARPMRPLTGVMPVTYNRVTSTGSSRIFKHGMAGREWLDHNRAPPRISESQPETSLECADPHRPLELTGLWREVIDVISDSAAHPAPPHFFHAWHGAHYSSMQFSNGDTGRQKYSPWSGTDVDEASGCVDDARSRRRKTARPNQVWPAHFKAALTFRIAEASELLAPALTGDGSLQLPGAGLPGPATPSRRSTRKRPIFRNCALPRGGTA